jgi:omega-amidase
VRRLLDSADHASPALVVLPEMFATGFSMHVEKISEDAGGKTEQFLAELAVERRAFVMAGVVGRQIDGRGRNDAVIFDPAGRKLSTYTKLNPFSLGGEAKHYARGDEVEVVGIGAWQMAPFVCYDLRFPEIFRHAAQRGANLMVVIANWPIVRIDHWTALLAARAIENQAYVVGVNRTGRDPHLLYSGRSAIFDPHGRAIDQLNDEVGLVTAQLDLAAITHYRHEFPFLADLRAKFLPELP